jgi:hypothetical protein
MDEILHEEAKYHTFQSFKPKIGVTLIAFILSTDHFEQTDKGNIIL